jgi:ketosteroid isomerase-like protein
MILSWLAKQLLTRVMARTRAGDIRPALALDHPDVKFTFPGDNSWSGTFNGKQEVKRWLERLARVGVKTFPEEVVAVGLPWNTTVCIRGTDYVRSPEGETVYENRFVIWAKLKWGRVKDYEVYEDTQKAKALDEWLTVNERRLVSAVAS